MSTVRLHRGEAEGGKLPAVCMRCGEPAHAWKAKKFSWCPSWVIVLLFAGVPVYVIVALLLTKRMKVRVPLCEAHQGHWFKRDIFNLCYLVFIVGLVVGTIMIPSSLGVSKATQDTLFGWACLSTVLALVVWIVIYAVVDSQMIGPKEITDRGITLKGVAPAFVTALEGWRGQEYDEPIPSVLPADSPQQIYDPKGRPPGRPNG